MTIEKVDRKYFHFSLDDVSGCTSRLSDYDGRSVFSDSTLSILKAWHDRYGIVVSLYCQGDFSVNSKYAEELIENSSWLKFGYHGIGETGMDMTKFYKQVLDSVGSDVVIDNCPRLNYFHGSFLTCYILKKKYGCNGFLACDDWSYNAGKRQTNYYLSDEQSELLDVSNRLLDTDNNIKFVKTDFRLEQIAQRWHSVRNCLNYYEKTPQADELIVFSHEWNFKAYVSQADSIFQWVSEHGYDFEFPMNL